MMILQGWTWMKMRNHVLKLPNCKMKKEMEKKKRSYFQPSWLEHNLSTAF